MMRQHGKCPSPSVRSEQSQVISNGIPKEWLSDSMALILDGLRCVARRFTDGVETKGWHDSVPIQGSSRITLTLLLVDPLIDSPGPYHHASYRKSYWSGTTSCSITTSLPLVDQGPESGPQHGRRQVALCTISRLPHRRGHHRSRPAGHGLPAAHQPPAQTADPSPSHSV